MVTESDPLKPTAIAARLKLAEQALTPFEAAHRDLSGSWAMIETKAQGATAIAGVFLGATISILTKSPQNLSHNQRSLIFGIACALAFAVMMALSALIPGAVPVVDNPEHRFRRVRDLLSLENDTEFLSLLPDVFTDEKDQWVKALASLRKASGRKATLLLLSHLATAVAVIAAVVLVYTLIDH
jgi:hypothetical protein